MSGIDLAAGAVLTLLLHATVLLGAVWLAERGGLLKHPGWAELAWRLALFGALATTSLQLARTWPVAEVSGTERPVAAAPSAAFAAPGRVGGPDAGEARLSGTRPDPAIPDSPRSDDAPAAMSPVEASRPVGPGSAPARGLTLALPHGAAFGIVGAWLLALVAGASRVLWQAAAVAALARRARRDGRTTDAGLQADLHHVASVLAQRVPPVSVLDGVASPLLLPGSRLLLPDWVPSLPSAQRRALLAHELAHVQRRDPRWRVLQRLAALPLAVHPFARHALARLDALAEDACDARAARVAGSGRPLAECLATCLAHAGPRTPVLAVAMADRPGPVVRRVRNLLENPPMSDRPVSPFLRRTAITLAVVAAVAIPGVAVTTFAADAFAEGLLGELGLDGEGGSHTYSVRDGDHALTVSMRGEVVFNDAETDVVSLGEGARLVVSEKLGGDEREIRMTGRDGAIQRDYRVDGEAVPLDAAGRAWLAKVLPGVIRESAMDADSRGRRILGKGGTDALLAEIALIDGGYARARYLEVLFEHAPLDDAQTAKALALAKAIESDYELRRALQQAVSKSKLSDARIAALLDAATAIDSDYEMAELLLALAGARAVDDGLLPAWRAAIGTIGSDYERRRVLDALLGRPDVGPAQVVIALEAADGIGSDYERRQVLEAATPHLRGGGAAAAAWFDALDGIGSDYERSVALKLAIDAGPVDVAFADRVLAALDGMGSGYEVGQVLGDLAAKMPGDPGLLSRYRAQARRLGDHERGQAERALDRFAG